MKRWAVLTVLLYAITLLVLTAPVLLIAFGGWANDGLGWEKVLGTYSYLAYWIWIGVLVAGQILLLLLPIRIAERRLPARRPLKTPVIVTAFLLAGLLAAGLVSLTCAVFRDAGLFAFAFLNPFVFNQPDVANANSGYGLLFGTGVLTLACWVIWAIIFRNAAKPDDPDALLKRATRWLLCGSILELLIAVPSHVIVRRRDDCCAPIGTFWGIATGISIMLLCFGPGVFFLFVERFQRLKPKTTGPDRPA